MKCVLGCIGQVIYATNGKSSTEAILYIQGLGDVLGSGCTKILNEFATSKNLFFVGIGTRSMPNYGIYQIENDAEDIECVYNHLQMKKYRRVWMIGHSTGCQALMIYAERAKSNTAFILQAPVSDREYEEKIDKNLKKRISIAENMNKNMIMPEKHNGNYITAGRYLDLFQKGGKEDIFSLGEDTSRVNRSNHRIYAIVSKNDEFLAVPLQKHIDHLKSINGMQSVTVIEAEHNPENEKEAVTAAINEILILDRRIDNISTHAGIEQDKEYLQE